MNRKGFSLIELIAMMVVLGILMLITVPNIAGIIKNNRENILKEDINKLVANAKTRVNTKQAKNPTGLNECAVMTLSYVDSNNDMKEGINGGRYSQAESFLVIRKELENPGENIYTYRYYVRLVEEVERASGIVKYEVPLTEHDELSNNSRTYLKGEPPTEELYIDMNVASNGEALNVINRLGEENGNSIECSSVVNIYKS